MLIRLASGPPPTGPAQPSPSYRLRPLCRASPPRGRIVTADLEHLVPHVTRTARTYRPASSCSALENQKPEHFPLY